MKYIQKIMVLLVALALSISCRIVPAMAAEAGGFSVMPQLPENQIPGTAGYFDLLVEPGQQQDLEISIVNKGDREISVTVGTVTATTNENGIINYTTLGESDSTLQYSFADFAYPLEESLTIPPQSAVDTAIRIELPEEPFEGMLLGSIQVLKDLTEEELNSGDLILNQYSFVIGVRLSQDSEIAAPDFTLGDVGAELTNGRASIVVPVRNIAPVIIKGMEASVEIAAKQDGTVVFDRQMTDVDMAPNSVFPMTLVDRAGYGIQPGTYIASVHLEFEGETWDFEQEFVIAASEASNINNNAVNQTNPVATQQRGMPTWAIVVGLVLLLLVIALLVALLKKKKD